MELIIPFKTIGMMVLLLIVPYLCFTTKDYPSCRKLPLFRKMKIKMEVFIMVQIKLKSYNIHLYTLHLTLCRYAKCFCKKNSVTIYCPLIHVYGLRFLKHFFLYNGHKKKILGHSFHS
jgi:hypothetical protein